MQTNDAVEVSEEYSTAAELLDSQFEKGWDAGVQAAFEIIEQELGRTGNEHMLVRLKSRFMRELEMEEVP